jgi:hypothetical protein
MRHPLPSRAFVTAGSSPLEPSARSQAQERMRSSAPWRLARPPGSRSARGAARPVPERTVSDRTEVGPSHGVEDWDYDRTDDDRRR